MKIGLPNILPLAGILFFGTVAWLTAPLLFGAVANGDSAAALISAVFLALCLGVIVLMGHRWKIVVLTAETVQVVFPLRFKSHRFAYGEIDFLYWDLWRTGKMGDYRKLVIRTTSGFRTVVSDLEFINFDALERCLMERTALDLDLGHRELIGLLQAKGNRWLNMVPMVFLALVALEALTGNYNPLAKFAAVAAIGFVEWRLLYRWLQCQRRIKQNARKDKWAAK